MTSLKLDFSPAECPLAVHIARRQSVLPFKLVRVDAVAARAEAGSEWRELNPRGNAAEGLLP